jgi:hypothetical protein
LQVIVVVIVFVVRCFVILMRRLETPKVANDDLRSTASDDNADAAKEVK